MADPLAKLYRRPGFMMRRAHQIAVSLFLEETRDLGITNTQYGILFVLNHHPGTDQATLARLLGLDRSTTGMVLKKLEGDGLVGRVVGTQDRRKHSLALTPQGRRTLTRLAGPARRAQARVLSAFAPGERETFLDLMEKLTRRFNDSVRAPLLARQRGVSSKAKPATRL
jgi:DNA-binding MarR family transcriptional regulator